MTTKIAKLSLDTFILAIWLLGKVAKMAKLPSCQVSGELGNLTLAKLSTMGMLRQRIPVNIPGSLSRLMPARPSIPLSAVPLPHMGGFAPGRPGCRIRCRNSLKV